MASEIHATGDKQRKNGKFHFTRNTAVFQDSGRLPYHRLLDEMFSRNL